MLHQMWSFLLPTVVGQEDKSNSLFEELFQKLDHCGNGMADITELQKELEAMGIPICQDKEDIFKAGNTNEDSGLDFGEFLRYLKDHEKKMRLAFNSLDDNNDGIIETSEIIAALKSLGVNISEAQAEKILQSIDSDGTMTVEWDKWKYYFLLHPAKILDAGGYVNHLFMHNICILLFIDNIGEDKEHKLQSQMPRALFVLQGMWSNEMLNAGHLDPGCFALFVNRLSDTVLVGIIFCREIEKFADPASSCGQQVHGLKSRRMRLIDGFEQMLKEGGILSLWRGNGVNIFKIIRETALEIGAYEQYKNWLSFDGAKVEIIERFISGSLAGATAQTCIYPMEVLKTRLAPSKTGQYSGIIDCGKKLLKEEGVRTFFKGHIPNLLGILPCTGIDFAVYEFLTKNCWLEHHVRESVDPGIMILLGCSILSHTCAQIATFPLTLFRTHMQVQALEEKETTTSMIHLIQEIHNNKGKRRFFRDLTPNICFLQ
ncbi:mitochondrial adenyl nucleotide antiporter SLC25A24-like [Mustela nigripes]|uniref:mitochondrial adenyl nucleotide antiporter SLC25A24-like n=1 Tax=Mustela nigripes TaxID=77151 RepID=UPI002814E7CB|nr:mitochondrial adenyl nucleotide antiporter SLC25A24-like [Mustela nigripes]